MRLVAIALAALAAVSPIASAAPVSAPDCAGPASDACYFAFEPAGAGGRLHYYASRAPDAPPPGPAPTTVLIALHGHSRDANKTFDAALSAVQRGGAIATTLVVAPVFQVDAARAGKCQTAGVPPAQSGDLLWTCASWPAGARAVQRGGAGPTSFAAMDALIEELIQRWPSLRGVTIAGFSAGAQMVQHYIGFAAARAAGRVTIRYVVADPGTWLYFDAARPEPADAGACPALNRWKYGTDALPDALGRSAADARARYADADIHYLEGERDNAGGRGTAYRVLDTSCAANAQGPYRLQRGLAYAAYDRALLAPAKQRSVMVVPGCAHDVACVFPSEAARNALLGSPH